MRIWDVPAGYLNRGSLLGEHRELHGIVSILRNCKRGYARHPETRRWRSCLRALARRHSLLVAEMALRGYRDLTPLAVRSGAAVWPSVFVTAPAAQYALLSTKYSAREPGRIALPRTTQQLWAQHKYSVMARDPGLYRATGRTVAKLRGVAGFDALARELVAALRVEPAPGRLRNALEHMWGHVADEVTPEDRRDAARDPRAMLRVVQMTACRIAEPVLCGSTALSELAVYVA